DKELDAAPSKSSDELTDSPSGASHGKELSIPQYETGSRVSEGHLVLEGKQPGAIKSWRVDLEWLRMNVRHYTSVQNLCIVTGFGPSMRPRFNPGDPLLMDKGITSMDVDGVYFFRVGDSGYIKQLQRIPSERGTIYRARSYNPDYEPFDITAKMDFQVFGKILTIWKSEQV
ncbi:S24 family peptidase, partial [Leptospira sp. 96542]|nr:S24 family peptidase [Leptospira sp. 96542]